MQLETADFAAGAATWLIGRNQRTVFHFGPQAPLCENDFTHKARNTQRIALSSEKN